MDDTTAIVMATALGPIAAVLITLWHQERTQKRSAKERLFIALMAHRKYMPPAIEWVKALNLIDVVYADHPKVIEAWHDLYDYVHIVPMDMKQYEHRCTNLLSEIASVLGYRNLKQTDIDKFYAPQAHGDQAAMNSAIQVELLGFFRRIQELAAAAQQKQGEEAKKNA